MKRGRERERERERERDVIMNYIRSLYHRSRELLLSLSDLDNLHRGARIPLPPLTLAARSPRETGTERERDRERERERERE